MKVHFQVEKSVIAAVVSVPDTHDRSVGGGDSVMADTARVAEEAVGGIIESNNFTLQRAPGTESCPRLFYQSV